jgi:hypothetical protein
MAKIRKVLKSIETTEIYMAMKELLENAEKAHKLAVLEGLPNHKVYPT